MAGDAHARAGVPDTMAGDAPNTPGGSSSNQLPPQFPPIPGHPRPTFPTGARPPGPVVPPPSCNPNNPWAEQHTQTVPKQPSFGTGLMPVSWAGMPGTAGQGILIPPPRPPSFQIGNFGATCQLTGATALAKSSFGAASDSFTNGMYMQQMMTEIARHEKEQGEALEYQRGVQQQQQEQIFNLQQQVDNGILPSEPTIVYTHANMWAHFF